MECEISPRSSSRKYFCHSIFVDGKRFSALSANIDNGTFGGSWTLPEGEKKICIYFPWSVRSTIKSITLDDGAGFTSGKSWLKIHPNYKSVNVEADIADEDGVIAFFKRVNAYRKSSETLVNGDFEEICATRRVYAFKRSYNGKELTAIFNFSTKQKRIPFSVNGEVVLSNYRGASGKTKLRPYEFLLVERIL